MNLKETYNKIAEDWAKDHRTDDWWIEGTDKFLSFLKPGDSILDVGSGPGIKAKYFNEKGLRVLGIDFAEKMIEIAQEVALESRFMTMDLRETSKIQENFDGIFMQASLLHIPKKEASEVIRGLTDKLNPGGYFYIAVKEVIPDKPEEEVAKENDYGYEYERFFSYYTLTEIKEYLKRVGMKIIWDDVSSTGRSNWIQVIAEKS